MRTHSTGSVPHAIDAALAQANAFVIERKLDPGDMRWRFTTPTNAVYSLHRLGLVTTLTLEATRTAPPRLLRKWTTGSLASIVNTLYGLFEPSKKPQRKVAPTHRVSVNSIPALVDRTLKVHSAHILKRELTPEHYYCEFYSPRHWGKICILRENRVTTITYPGPQAQPVVFRRGQAALMVSAIKACL